MGSHKYYHNQLFNTFRRGEIRPKCLFNKQKQYTINTFTFYLSNLNFSNFIRCAHGF